MQEKGKGFFITATDTGIGKTFITALLGRELKKKGRRVGVIKSVSSGCSNENGLLVSEDAVFLKNAIGLESLQEEISPIRLSLPLAPLSVVMETDEEFDLDMVFTKIKELEKDNDVVLVEGIGGLMVPLKNKYYVLDLIKDINYPVIVVSRPNLGTINHTLLTIEQLKKYNIKISGIVINYYEKIDEKDISVRTNRLILEKETGIKNIIEVSYIENIDGFDGGDLLEMLDL